MKQSGVPQADDAFAGGSIPTCAKFLMYIHQKRMEHDLPCICAALRKASRAMSRLYDERLAGDGMTITQFSILRSLEREGDLPLSRLADLLVMERTSLYRTLAPIERRGWLAIKPGHPTRTKVASLTNAGRAALEAATGAWGTTQGDVVETIGLPDFQALKDQLEKLASFASRVMS